MNKALEKTFGILPRTKKSSPPSYLKEESAESGDSLSEKEDSAESGDSLSEVDDSSSKEELAPTSGKAKKTRTSIATD